MHTARLLLRLLATQSRIAPIAFRRSYVTDELGSHPSALLLASPAASERLVWRPLVVHVTDKLGPPPSTLPPFRRLLPAETGRGAKAA